MSEDQESAPDGKPGDSGSGLLQTLPRGFRAACAELWPDTVSEPPLSELLRQRPELDIITRLTCRPTTSPDWSVTVWFEHRVLEVEVILMAQTFDDFVHTAWKSRRTVPEETDRVRRLEHRARATVDRTQGPRIFEANVRFLELAHDIGDCRAPAPQSVTYVHETETTRESLRSNWVNPRRGIDQPQIAILEAYWSLAEPLFPPEPAA